MAFGFVKEAVDGIGWGVSFVVKQVKKLPRPITRLAYEILVPAPVRKITSMTKRVVECIPGVKVLIKRIGGSDMNPLEKFIRAVVAFGEAMKDGISVSDAAQLIDLVVTGSEVYGQFNSLPLEHKMDMLREALDRTLGDEPDAIIGPNGKIKLDIPIVNDEKAYDVVINAAVDYLEKKLKAPASDG